MGVLRLLGPDQSTVLWDFDDPTGAANPNTVQTDLMVPTNLGTDQVIHRLLSRGDLGSESLGYDLEPVEASITFKAKATTDVNLWTGLGQLGRYLLAVNKDNPLFLEWTELASNTRYMDIVGALNLPQIVTGSPGGALSALRATALDGITIRVLRQPWMRGADVTIGPTDVPNDPASTNGRALSVSITGDLPTPVRVQGRMEGVDRTLSLSAAADDIIDCTAHGFAIGQAVIFTSLTGGAGLTAGTTYWVISTSFGANTFRVAATKGGTALGFTTDITAGTVIDAPYVQKVQIAAHTTKGLRNAAALADYQDASNVRLCQLEGNNGVWTVTLNTGTTADADAQASPGGAGNTNAETVHTDTRMDWRVRATATAVEPLRGEWDVWLRARPGTPVEVQMAWGPSTATPFPFVNPVAEVQEEDVVDTTYQEVYLGVVSLPLAGTLTGFGFELRSRDEGGATSLNSDFVHFVSRDQQATIVVPAGNTTRALGKDLDTPHDNPAGGTGGTDSGNSLVLDTTTDNAGTLPITGTVYTAGRWVGTVRLHRPAGAGSTIVDVMVRNVTSSTTVVTTSQLVFAGGTVNVSLGWDADGTSAYQVQVDNPTNVPVNIRWIDVSHMPALTNDQGFRTDPSKPSVERVNSSGSVTGYLDLEGTTPLLLEPGTNIVTARILDIPGAGDTANETRRQRQMALTLTYPPRYAL